MQGKRASNIEVKRINRNQVYWLINQRERISKPEIAAALGLSMPTVLQKAVSGGHDGVINMLGN